MDDAKRDRTESKRMFTRAGNALEAAINSTDCVVMTLQRRFDEFKLRWDDVQSKHDRYITTLDAKTDQEIKNEDEWIDELSNTFYHLEEITDKFLTEETIKQAIILEKKLDIVVAGKNSTIQLERLKVRKFDGDIRKYPRFRDEFIKHVMPICSKSQQAIVLRSYLSDEVCEEMESIGDDVDAIFARLDELFGNTGKLVDTIMAEFKDLSKCSSSYSSETLELIKIIEKAYSELDRLGEKHQMDNATILSNIEHKLPEEISNKWIKLVVKGTNSYNRKFPTLLKLLTEWRRRIKYKLANIRNTSDNCEEQMRGNTFHGQGVSQNNRQTRKQNCWIHVEEGRHPIWRCQEFQERSVNERIELAKLNRTCFQQA